MWGEGDVAARFGLLSVIYELPQSNGTTGTQAACRGMGVDGEGGKVTHTSTIIIRHCI